MDENAQYGREFTPTEFEAEEVGIQEAGFEVVHADECTLLLDLDGPDALVRYLDAIETVDAWLGAKEVGRWASKSGQPDHLHVILRLDVPLDVPTRLLLQACLGSDPQRELLSFVRFRNGVPEPTRLFKPSTPVVLPFPDPPAEDMPW